MEVAMKAFKLAVSKFPESPNAFDSLVETYYTNHEYDVAFSSYKKALRFNLNYFNAVGASELIENINGKLATTQYYIYNGWISY